MKKLNTEFTRNGLLCEIIQRNDVVALYSVSCLAQIVEFRVCTIHINEAEEIVGRQLPERETMPNEDEFNGESINRIFEATDLKQAKEYFEKLTHIIKTKLKYNNTSGYWYDEVRGGLRYFKK